MENPARPAADARCDSHRAMRPDQAMGLGIPGSTAGALFDQDSGVEKKTAADTANIAVPVAAGSVALASMHMAQHVMQIGSPKAGAAGVLSCAAWWSCEA